MPAELIALKRLQSDRDLFELQVSETVLPAVVFHRGQLGGVAVKSHSVPAMQQLCAANHSQSNLWRFIAHTGIRRGEPVHLRNKKVVAGRLLSRATQTRMALSEQNQESGESCH